jgi:hypothetical protein
VATRRPLALVLGLLETKRFRRVRSESRDLLLHPFQDGHEVLELPEPFQRGHAPAIAPCAVLTVRVDHAAPGPRPEEEKALTAALGA